MQKQHSRSKRILIDIAGVGLIILSGLLGWLPGPGGVPLFLGGLGLLSINHEWAFRLRQYFIKRGSTFWRALFSDNPRIQWVYDVLTLGLLYGLFLSFNYKDRWYGISVIIFITCICLVIFFSNRRRAERLRKWSQNRRKHKN